MEHYSCHKLAVIGDTYDLQVFVKLSLLHCGPHASVYLYSYYCMIAMRALEVQLWYFVYRIEHLCGQCRDTAAIVSRWKKNRIIVIQEFKHHHVQLQVYSPPSDIVGIHHVI
jgi:hypothetical protein